MPHDAMGRPLPVQWRSERAVAWLFVVLATSSGCDRVVANRSQQPPADRRPPPRATTAAPSAAPPNLSPQPLAPAPAATTVRQIALRLEVLRVEVPRGAISENRGLWELLDEVAASPSRTVILRGNGFRFAVGTEAAKPGLRRALDAIPGLRVAHDDGLPRADRPTEIGLTDSDHDYSVFFFDESGHLRGLTFDDARPYFRVQFAIEVDQHAMVRLSVVPEMREPPGDQHYVKTSEGFRPEREYRGRIFEELAIQPIIPAGGFLIIGGTAQIDRTPLLGRPFLTVMDSDPPRENAFVLIPHLDETTSWWSGNEVTKAREGSP